MNMNRLNSLCCADLDFAVRCPLVDSADRGDGGSAAPENDGPRDRDGEPQQSCSGKYILFA